MPWDSVEVGLAGGEETVNFGPRNESGSSLYQVDTLASVSPREDVTSCPHVCGSSCPEGFCLVASSQVILFNASCVDVHASLKFECEIDCVAWSDDSLFLAIGERSGTFHFLHVASRQILFSQELDFNGNSNSSNKERTFLSMMFTKTYRKEGSSNLAILSASGNFTEFSNLCLERINDAIVGGRLEAVSELKEMIQVKSADVRAVHEKKIAGFTVGSVWEAPALITYGEGEAAIAVWTCQEKNGITLTDSISSYILGGSGVEKANISSNGHFLVVLDDKNMLSLWNVASLTMVAFWSFLNVEDFLLLPSSNIQTPGASRKDDDHKLVVLTSANGNARYFQVYAFPSMKQMYSLEVSFFSFLAQCPSTQESIYFIEGLCDIQANSETEPISCLRIRSLTEALPENRLSRLLHKQKFSEALKFAQQFNLDIELVYKVKANWLLDKVSPWNNNDKGTAEEEFSLSKLKNCFSQIKDDEYVCRCCLQAALSSLEETFDLLSYARKRISLDQDKKEGICGMPSHLLTEVLEALDRLATFEMAYGIENFSGTQWQYFVTADLLAELIKCLLSGKVTSAVIIWRRHQTQFIPQFTEGKLESLLGSISQALPSSTIIPWLQDDLVPFVSKVLPQGLRMLAGWLEQRARNMELSEKEGWPQNSLKLASVFLSASKSVSGSASGRGLATPGQFVDQVCGLPATARALLNGSNNCNLNTKDELGSLMNMVQQLSDLVDLHTKYCCKITLAEFSQETTSTIVFRLLDRVVAAELIPNAIAKYIAPYMVHHSLDRDTMLLHYIEDLFNRSAGAYSALSNSLWEARVIAVISCIKDKEVRCKATLEIMRHAMIPWSKSVENLVTEFMAEHPDDLNLKEQYRLVELKRMLSRYGLRTFHVSYASKAKAIVRYILTRDEPTVMEDALKVVRSFSHITEDEAYVVRLQKLCIEKKVPECLELLQSLPLHQAEKYAHELVTWLCGILDEEGHNEQESNLERNVAVETGIAVLKFMKTHGLFSLLDVDEYLSSLQLISALQKDFPLFLPLSIEECQMSGVRKDLFEKYLQKYLDFQDGKDCDEFDEKKDPLSIDNQGSDINLSKLFRLGELVGLTRANVRLKLTLELLSKGHSALALDTCRELIETAPCEASSQTLYMVARRVCETLSEGNLTQMDKNKNLYDITHSIHQLLCQACTHCSEDLLCDCAELCKCCRLTESVYSQCESGDYGFSVQSSPQSSNQDSFNDWMFGKRFKEDSLVLDSFIAIPLAAKLSIAAVPGDSPDKQGPFYHFRVAGRRQLCQESKADESGEGANQMSSYLMSTSGAGLNIIRHLQENSLCHLALQYLVETLGLCLQHFASNNMFSTGEEGERTNQIEKQRVAKIAAMGAKMINELTGTLLRKVFNCRTVDHDVGLAYLCSIPKQTACQYLMGGTNFLGGSCSKILAFAKVGIDYAQLCNEPALLDKCQDIATNATWGIRLGRLKMSLKDVYKSDREEKLAILPDLMQNQQITLEMIQEFCRAFKLDEDSALLTYVRQQLLPPASPTSCSSPLLSTQVSIEELPYQQNVRKVVHKIAGTTALLNLLVEVGSKVEPYDYDRILFILELIKQMSREDDATAKVEKGIQLLEYLYQYERKASPSSYEKAFCNSKISDGEKVTLERESVLSPLSKLRLPYHPLLYGDPWKVLTPELSEDTVPKLVGIANLLKLSIDQLYLTAIRNLARPSTSAGDSSTSDTNLGGSSAVEGSSSHLAKNYNSEKAKTMLYSIKNKEMAIAAAKWIAQQLPLGEEKIDILKTCVDLAMAWKSFCSKQDEEKAKYTHSRLLELTRGVATEHILYKYNITDSAIVSLTSKPAKLICQLYENYGAREPGSAYHPPDISKATCEIANVNNTIIEKIRLHLIEKWLPSSSQTTGGDPEFTSPGDEESDESEEDEQNLKRVIYIMQSNDQEASVRFLLNIANKTGSSSSCRVRSLRALFSVAPGELIERLCNTSVNLIRQQMQALVCLAELEGLHIQQTASAFDKCNKEGLVRGLWRNHKHEKKAVRLVADLCLDNNIHDPQLWNSVLLQLLAFGMLKYLRRVLVNLAGISALWQVRCLPQVWRSVLTAPFKSVSSPLSDDELAACEESASLLQRCPLLLDLDVQSIAVQFHKVGLQAHALACLLLIPSSTAREQHIQSLLQTNCVTRILSQLDEQRQRGRTLTQADIVEEKVFQYVEQKQEYQILLETSYFDKFLTFLIMNRKIAGILLKTIQANRVENAIQLVRLFHQTHPDLPSSQYVAVNKLNGFEELWTFLDVHGMLDDCLPFLPKLDVDQDEDPTEEQSQILLVEKAEETVNETGIEYNDHESFSMMLTGDCSVEFPI
ncbi:kinetochore-associated protein 1-like isoform X1 [Montipora foliosa]|uniref:kinetochore-associated protein 1-like isoform X1 n=1 Tax=Montipora foliosa TaxID=591990 RepID=UPI0035F19235